MPNIPKYVPVTSEELRDHHSVGCVSTGRIKAAALLFDHVLVPNVHFGEYIEKGIVPYEALSIVHNGSLHTSVDTESVKNSERELFNNIEPDMLNDNELRSFFNRFV